MFIGLLNIAGAVILSLVSMFFSVTGIMTIFSGAAIGAGIMGAALEFSKIGATLWLYAWWRKASKLLRYYLTFAVVVLILISSIGIFGYLSSAFVAQQNPTQEVENRIERIDLEIEREQRKIDRAQGSIDVLDESIATYFEYDSITRGLEVREEQAPERAQLNTEIDDAQDNIDELLDERLVLVDRRDDFSVDVGPIKYIATLIYGEDRAEDNFDNAVRIFIIMLVLVFDPFAVLMMVAGNIAIDGARANKRKKKPGRPKGSKNAKRKTKPVQPKTPSKGKNMGPSNETNAKVDENRTIQTKKGEKVSKESEATPTTKKNVVEIDMSDYVNPEQIKELKGNTEHLPFRKKPKQS